MRAKEPYFQILLGIVQNTYYSSWSWVGVEPISVGISPIALLSKLLPLFLGKDLGYS